MKSREFVKQSVLTTSAVGLATSGLSSCTTIKNSMKNLKTTHKGHFPNIIVGSGYGGAVTALRLTEAGHKTLIIEMGQRWDRTDKHNTFCKMIQADKRSSWNARWPAAPIPIPIPIKRYAGVLDKVKHPAMDIFVGRAYGGGSIVNGAIAITPNKSLFKEVFPQIDSDEMFDKFFPLANKELKVNQIPKDLYENSRYYQFSRQAEKQAHKAGLKTKLFSNSYDFDYMRKEDKGKVYKSGLGGEVIYGNNAGKFSLDLTYLKKAEETGKLEISTLRKVSKISKNNKNQFTIEVEVLNEKTKTVGFETLTCDKLFLNCGSLGTSKLLMKSKYEGDLPNLNDEIGKTWGPNGNIMTGRNFVSAGGSKQATIPVAGIDLWEGYPYKIFAEIAPLPLGIETWTTLLLTITDNPERGYFKYNKITKKVELIWGKNQNDYSKKAVEFLLKKLKDGNGGTRSRLLFNNGFGDDFCYHPLGGCVLGKATDDLGRVKGYENLYVNDSSLIPGSAGVNPYVFITGLAERNMHYILKEDFKMNR